MGAPTPQLLLEAIASAAGGGFITNPIPVSPTGTNAASISGGFPPITMQSEVGGGEPPLGQDMNGYLYLITSHTLYVECGQLYIYNSTLAAAIGGYLAGTVLGMTDGTGMWLCTANGNTSNPDTGGAGWVPITAYGKTTVPVTGGTVALTSTQSKYGVIILTGVLASNLVVQLPQTIQEWLIINATSGAFTTTVNTAASGSAGVVASQGGFGAPIGVYSVGDGNIYPTVAPLSLNISVAPTVNSIVQRSNSGYVLATYFNTSAGTDNLTPETVFTNSGDGYLRQNTLTNFESFLNLAGFSGSVTNGQVPYSVVQQWVSTFLNNPTLTGVPVAPTAGLGSSGAQIATTAFANPGVTVNSNGVAILLPNNYKIQMGTCNPNGGSAAVTFPVPFSSSVYPVAISLAGGSVQTWLPSGNPPTLTGMHVSNSGGSSFWIAIGL
jgi:hypothetical protein